MAFLLSAIAIGYAERIVYKDEKSGYQSLSAGGTRVRRPRCRCRPMTSG